MHPSSLSLYANEFPRTGAAQDPAFWDPAGSASAFASYALPQDERAAAPSTAALSGTPSPAAEPGWSPQTQMWMYLDLQGVLQGPFSGEAMQVWYEQHYLHSELLVRREEETHLRPLHVLLAEVGDAARPFTTPPLRIARPPPVRTLSHAFSPASPFDPADGSPRVQAAAAAHVAPIGSPRVATPDTAQAPAAQPAAAAHERDAPSNLSSDDIATAVRVMGQLQSLLSRGATEAQSTQILQHVLASSLPHTNAAGLGEMLALLQQATADEAQAVHAEAQATGETQHEEEHKEQRKPPAEAPREAPPKAQTEELHEAPPSAEIKPATRKNKGAKAATSKAAADAPTEPATDAPAADAAASTPTSEPPSAEVSTPRAAAKPAPWAKPSTPAAPSMREILEAEQRERKAQVEHGQAMDTARLAQAMAQMNVSSATTSASRPSPGGPAWNIPTNATPIKSLSQIQREESAQAQRAQAAQGARPSAYSSSAQRASPAASSPAAASRRAEDAWVKVGPHGKTVPLPAKPAAPKSTLPSKPVMRMAGPPVTAAPAPAPANASSAADEDGWITKKSKGQVRRDALSQMNDAIPRPTGSAAGFTAPRRTTPSMTPQPPSPEFLRYCREQLKGLRVDVNEFIEMLLTFPLNPPADVTEIIAEAIYANSSTLDGRRFAADFVTRRKADAYRAVTV